MIDFELDEDQQLIQETVTAFASEVIRPAAHHADETGAIPATIVDQAWELGLIPAFIPEEYGGYATKTSALTEYSVGRVGSSTGDPILIAEIRAFGIAASEAQRLAIVREMKERYSLPAP